MHLPHPEPVTEALTLMGQPITPDAAWEVETDGPIFQAVARVDLTDPLAIWWLGGTYLRLRERDLPVKVADVRGGVVRVTGWV